MERFPGLDPDIEKYKSNLRGYKMFEDIVFKEDDADENAFNKIHIRVKDEIVNSNLKDTSLANGGKKLSLDELLEFYEVGKRFYYC